MAEPSKYHLPGWDTYPEYTMRCLDCEVEFVVSGPKEEVDAAVCVSCASENIKLRYISYPTDGPGFQEGYDPSGLIYGGGAASGSGNDTDIADLPLKVEKIKIKNGKVVTDEDTAAE